MITHCACACEPLAIISLPERRDGSSICKDGPHCEDWMCDVGVEGAAPRCFYYKSHCHDLTTLSGIYRRRNQVEHDELRLTF